MRAFIIGAVLLSACALAAQAPSTPTGPITVKVSSVAPPVPNPTPNPSALPLFALSDLVDLGAFRTPAGIVDGQEDAFAYVQGGLAIDPAAPGKLFFSTFGPNRKVAQITIPALVKGPITALNRATLVQGPADLFEGRSDAIFTSGSATKVLGGLTVVGPSLVVSEYPYYALAGSEIASHFTHALTFSTPSVAGPWKLGDIPTLSNGGIRFWSAYMNAIPAAFQAAFHGSHFSGNCCLSIISTTSFGPAVGALNLAQLGSVTPLPVTPLVYYDAAHPLAQYGMDTTANRQWFNGPTQVTGVVMIPGYRTVMFVGRQGTGQYCYGEGTPNQALAGTIAPSGAKYCYDPAIASKGEHGYPYSNYAWLYDGNDFAAVAAGSMLPWVPRPYAVGQLPWDAVAIPDHGAGEVGGATNDATTHRLYVTQRYADVGSDGSTWKKPIVRVFGI